jgi:hypothetical protein
MRTPPGAALLPVNELAMNLAAERVDHGYLQFLVVPQAAIADMLCKLFAVFDCLGVALEFKAEAISHRNAVFHVKEKRLHGGQSLMV